MIRKEIIIRNHELTQKLIHRKGYLMVCLMLMVFYSFTANSFGQTQEVKVNFMNPGTEYRPHIRMWLPNAFIEESALRNDIKTIASVGFGDIEIAGFDFKTSLKEDSAKVLKNINSQIYGWGTKCWEKTMEAVLDQCGKSGIKATFTMGPEWPIASPLLKKDSPGVGFQLACTKIDLNDNAYHGQIIGNNYRDDVPSKFVAVVAGKRDSTDGKVKLDIETLKDLTSLVTLNGENYLIDWNAPDSSGLWSLYFYWCEPVGETVCDMYVIDHFGAEGAQAVIDYYQEVFRIFKELNILQYLNGLFGDSLEYHALVEWTPQFLETFKRLKGYDLTPYLPAIMSETRSRARSNSPIFGGRVLRESFDTRGNLILNDYYDVLSNMFNENHLGALQKFLGTYGMSLRYQTAYGKKLEQSSASMYVGIPEGEMMMIRNSLDNIRAQAGAVHLTNKPEYNVELQAEMRQNHAQSWENLLFFAQRAFAAGANNITLHGYVYAGAFSKEGNINGALPGLSWPGLERFGRNGYSNSWGTEPLWTQAKQYTDFIARNSYVLKQGQAKIDLAVYRESFLDNATFSVKDGDVWFKDNSLLQNKGYSYDFVGLSNLNTPAVTVHDGCLASDGPAYKVLILNQTLNSMNVAVDPESMAISLGGAKKLLELAEAGLPIVYIRELPSKCSFYNPKGAADVRVREIMQRLKQLPNVKKASSMEELPKVLLNLGIRPRVEYSLSKEQPGIINMYRQSDSIDYCYLYNRGFNSNSGTSYGCDFGRAKEFHIPDVAAEITFHTTGRPYLMDAWTGSITPIACYSENSDGITIPINLLGNESAIIAFDKSKVLGNSSTRRHLLDSKGTKAFYNSAGKLAVKIAANGTYDFVLNDGSINEVTTAKVPSVIKLSNWHLSAEIWSPGNTPIDTKKNVIAMNLDSLKSWSEIDELKNESGIGTYYATFKMDKGWRNGIGAYLNLGLVNYGYHLKVNGKEVLGSQLNTLIDIGTFVRKGTNTIEIEVPTTLNNKLKDLYGSDWRNKNIYGLLGVGDIANKNRSAGIVEVIPYIVIKVE